MQMLSNWLIWQIADSAFPAGGFVHSWGLEAAWQSGEVASTGALRQFLHNSLWQTGHGSLPLLSAAYRAPDRLAELDALCDAFLINAVGNRASRAQGRAFLSTCAKLWPCDALARLEAPPWPLCGHHAPLTGAILRALDIPLDVAQRLFLYLCARGVLAAAVRLGIVGTYQAQRLQYDFREVLDAVLVRCGTLDQEDIAQTAPILDLLQASHDRLYSRLFQS
jgi:urease accessory protein